MVERMKHAMGWMPVDQTYWPDGKPRTEPKRSRVPGCPTCDRDPEGRALMPPHDASDRCESGKHPHCSCDTCF
jgi:hypothetical protein